MLALLTLFTSLLLAQETGARYLIITHDDYRTALEPLATWKTQKGIRAKIVTLSETGADSTDIKNYIVNAYNTWQTRPEYLLIVGNKYQVPFPRFVHAVSLTSYSDNYYANVDGDFRNELYHGRLWVSDTVQAKTVVAKILGYERNPDTGSDSLWFRKGVTIVNEWEQGQPSSAELYWADARFAHQYMLAADFVHIDSFSYELGHDSLDVLNAINEGRTYILFRGIAGGDWLWPFAGINASQMTNGYRMPVVLSATCATIEGIGRDWTIAGTPSVSKGVIGFFGTTTSLFAAAEMRSVLSRATTQCLFSDTGSLGASAEAGRLAYYAEYNDLIEYHSWMCLGDPEMLMWTSTPKPIVVGHNMYFHTGICTATVYVQSNSVPVQGALVCVMAKSDSSFYHSGYTDDLGSIRFIDTLNIPGDSVFITVTGRDLRPYHNGRPVLYMNGPYVSLYSYRLLDSLGGNGDGIANPGEDIELPFCLKNWGNTTAYGVSAAIEKNSPGMPCTLYDTIKYLGNIAPYESVHVYPDGYNVVIDSNCADLIGVDLQLRITDSGTATWTSNLDFIVHAPIISYHDYYFDQYVKYTNAGDTSQLYVELLNTGSYKAENPTGIISCSDSFVTIVDSMVTFTTIYPDSIGSNMSDPFLLTTASNTPIGYIAMVSLHISAGVYTAAYDFPIHVGQKDYLVWDPDMNHSSGPVIDALLDSLGFGGDYSTSFPYGLLSLYRSLYVCAGVYPENYAIGDTSQTGYEIEHYLQLEGGNVYLEGGDVWYSPLVSHGYDFGPLFGIDPVYNSIGLFAGVTGCNGTITQNMAFGYQGEATMIDYIDSTGGSQLLFKKTGSNYGCGVAANNRTVGLSFELSGLIDSVTPSTKVDLIAAIMNYFSVPPTGVTKEQDFSSGHATPMLLINPNPARYGFNITLQGLPGQKTTLKVYDVSGRCVSTLIDNAVLGEAQQPFFWNGLDDRGRRVPAGIYFVRLIAPRSETAQKIVLID
ncbi:MAG: T9SS type A sorting domain-containing protein [candidate division WOR-3 bacterium]|nr:MAG: T9SS type A sorting domain-containing protein [candidate division WOR-3 bacterium]